MLPIVVLQYVSMSSWKVESNDSYIIFSNNIRNFGRNRIVLKYIKFNIEEGMPPQGLTLRTPPKV